MKKNVIGLLSLAIILFSVVFVSAMPAPMNCTIENGRGSCGFAEKNYSVQVVCSSSEANLYISYDGALPSNYKNTPYTSTYLPYFFIDEYRGTSGGANPELNRLWYFGHNLSNINNILLPDGTAIKIISPSSCDSSKSSPQVNLSFSKFRDPFTITEPGEYHNIHYGDRIKIGYVDAIIAGVSISDSGIPSVVILQNNPPDNGEIIHLWYDENPNEGPYLPREVIITYGLTSNSTPIKLKVNGWGSTDNVDLTFNWAVLNVSYVDEKIEVINPTNETGPIEIPSNETTSENDTEKNKPITTLCSGCESNNLCYPFGYRKSGGYCSETKQFVAQLESGACSNSFECSSNVCVNDECVGRSFLQKIIDWFKNLFGA